MGRLRDAMTRLWGLHSILPVINRAASITADILALYFTWTRIVMQIWVTRRPDVRPPKIIMMVLRNGILQFGTMLALNIITMTLDIMMVATDGSIILASKFIYFKLSISAVLVCRFLLDLRSIDFDPGHEESQVNNIGSVMSTIQFTGYVYGGTIYDEEEDPNEEREFNIEQEGEEPSFLRADAKQI
ncbi:hypothetical protein K474DRAFT_268796 [Panus rudis PR-1116 ss-1]|nr:hypothetical protein K474DRAFT_268796 [Panus rudis PR-1116 ss-1]